ncbi:MAG TPA: hypothetical protein VKO18_04780 [Terriglobia bacterium]|nr:hypothetical protein [Terriglobia bacterium]
MSLIEKHEMTEKKLAANRRNQKLSDDAETDERHERIRAALRRFGCNAPAEEMAMRALGEDPADFQELLEGLWEEYNPVGASQEGVVIRLARAMWLMNRADRMQEGYAVRQAQEVSSGREDRLHAQMMRLKITADSLRLLVQSVAREHYVTPPADLEKMKNLYQEGVLKDMGEIALALFYQLQAPGTGEDGIDPNEMSRRALMRIKEIFGLNSDYPHGAKVAPHSRPPQESPHNAQAGVMPDFSPADADPLPSSGQALKVGTTREANPYPNITEAEWDARERPRQLLENILTGQVEICEEQRKALLKESVKGPSPYERAAEIAPTHPNARLMRRMQDSNFREVRRLTTLLLKIKRYQRQMEGVGKSAACQDVPETKGVND